MEGLHAEIPLFVREREKSAEKSRIAAQAVRFVRDGDTLFLDASSTVFQLLELLEPFHNLTVVTNGPKTALALAQMHIRTYCTGGLTLNASLAYVGRQAERFLHEFNADTMFFSCRGVSEAGKLTDSSMEEAQIRQAMLQNAKNKIFLCDSSKLLKTYTYTICTLRSLDAFLCDAPLPAVLQSRLDS